MQGQTHLLLDLVVTGDRLLGLVGERYPHAGHVHHDRHRPAGEAAARLRQAVRTPVGRRDRLGDRAVAMLELQRHPVGVAIDVHRLSFADVDVLHGVEQRVDLARLELVGAFASAQLRCFQNLVGRVGAQPVEGHNQKLPHRSRIALGKEFFQQFLGDLLRFDISAVGQGHFDLKWVAPIHRGRTGGGGVELGRNHAVQPFEQLFLADRHDTVGRRVTNLGVLNGGVERLGVVAVDALDPHPRAQLGLVANLFGDAGADAGKRIGQKPGQACLARLFAHADQPPQFYAVRVRFNLGRFGRQHLRRTPIAARGTGRVGIVQRHMRVGDRRLLQVLVDAPLAPLVFGFQFQSHPGAMGDWPRRCLGRIGFVMGGPLDTTVLDILLPFFARRDIFSLSLAVEDFRLVDFGVDP